MLRKIFLLYDIFFLLLITAISFWLVSFYLNVNYINTQYPDWIVHAFRVKFLQNYGLLSWTHIWSNGINIWKAYQFIPHFITLLISNYFHLSITRAMVLLTIGQFIFLRLLIYIIVRFLGFTPLTAFVAAIISIDIAQYWSAVGDYSLLFGVTLFPLILYIWTFYVNDKLTYLFPFIAGFLFYIHPVLALHTVSLWFVALVFSSRKIFTISALFQIIVFLIASSLFWIPIVFKNSYTYTNSVLGSQQWLANSLTQYNYWGLSLFLIVALGGILVYLLLPVGDKKNWQKILFIYITCSFAFVLLQLNISLPIMLTKTQFARGISFIGLAIVFCIVPIIDSLFKMKSFILRGIFAIIFVLIFVECIWFTSIYSPQPIKTFDDPVSYFIKQSNLKDIAYSRIWSPTIDVTSYYAPLSLQLPYSYMGHLDSNQVSPQMNDLLNYQPFIEKIPSANIERINNYFKISGTKYVLFDETSVFTPAYQKGNFGFKDLGKISMPHEIYHAFKVPWKIENAILLNNKYISKINYFPFDINIDDSNGKTALDEYVTHFTQLIFASENNPLDVRYPSQDSVTVTIPSQRISSKVFLNESYDTSWKATFNGKLKVA